MKHGRGQGKDWFPLYIDKWIFGSTRIELIIHDGDHFIDLRGIWVDLLALSKKDSGYIRANEITPYHRQQLAAMCNVPLEYLEKTIEICLKVGKLSEPTPGIYYVLSHDEFELGRTTKYYAEHGRCEQSGSHSDKKCSPRGEERREEESIIKESPTDSPPPAEIDKPQELVDFWNVNCAPPIPMVRDLNPGRRAKFNRFLKIKGWEQAFREGVLKVSKSDFCKGKVPTAKCPSGWTVTIDFMLANDTNAFKAAEGNYDRAGRRTSGFRPDSYGNGSDLASKKADL